MSRKEVQDAMHPAKSNEKTVGKATFLDGVNISKKNTAKGKPVDMYYGKDGKAIEDVDKGFAYYTEYPDGKKFYYIKFATAGSAMGRMLNTNGMYYREGDENKYETSLARKTYEFKRVSERTFELYLKFLKTKNEKYILEAERESINGQG